MSKTKTDNQKCRLKRSRWFYLLRSSTWRTYPTATMSMNLKLFTTNRHFAYLSHFFIFIALVHCRIPCTEVEAETVAAAAVGAAVQSVSTVSHEYFNEILVIGFRKKKKNEQQFTVTCALGILMQLSRFNQCLLTKHTNIMKCYYGA